MVLQPLSAADLEPARALLGAALPRDRVADVAAEKLFGDNGAREGHAVGAFEGGALVGVLATAGRWVKLLAVAEGARGRGVGSALLDEARRRAGGAKLRIFDQPGNYLSPGLDVHYQAGRAFLEKRGFRVLGEVENLRAPVDDNARLSDDHSAALDTRCDAAGYRVARVADHGPERAEVLELVARTFHPVWALEVERALDGPRRAVHAAFDAGGAPVAFAAADGNNQGLGWFGPAGTHPDHRKKGLAEALLVRCLRDVRGLPEAGVIAWVGPKDFYFRAVGAVSDRRFLTMESAS